MLPCPQPSRVALMRSLGADLAVQRAREGNGLNGRAHVEPEHREDLKTLLDVLRASVELESRCDYADPPNGQRLNRRAFMAHFGELGALLTQWDTAVERMRIAPGGLWEWFALAAADRGIAEPPFVLGALIDRLAIWTVERSRHGELGHRHELDLQHFKDGFGEEQYLSVYVEGQKVARLPVEPNADLERRAEAADELIRRLFADAQRCEEAQEIGDARDALLDFKQQVLDRLSQHATGSAILAAADCPFCVRQLEQDLRS